MKIIIIIEVMENINFVDFKIVKDNKKSLRERSIDISLPLNKEIEELGLNMLNYLILSQDEEFLNEHKKIRSGVGIAAPQIGKNINLIAIYFKDENDKEVKYVLVNPKIISESTKKCYLPGGEGCLSVDKAHEGLIYRSYKIKVKAFNILNKKEEVIDLIGYSAIVAQHEIDHLKGVLFYDYINKDDPFKQIDGAIAI